MVDRYVKLLISSGEKSRFDRVEVFTELGNVLQMEVLLKMDNGIISQVGIGTQNERSLHAALKQWYSMPGDQLEVSKDGYIIDIVRDDLLIEIQTGNFSAIKKKLQTLIRSHKVRLVYPIPRDRWIVVYNENQKDVIRRRKSPKTGEIIDLFAELVRIPTLINQDNLSIEILLIQEEEIRCNDGKGSWRRQGISIIDRRLVDVLEQIIFTCKEDFLSLLPGNLAQPFTNKSLARELGIRVSQTQKMTYCLKKMQAIKEVGKNGNALLYQIF